MLILPSAVARGATVLHWLMPPLLRDLRRSLDPQTNSESKLERLSKLCSLADANLLDEFVLFAGHRVRGNAR